MRRKELTKTFMIISNRKNPLVSSVFFISISAREELILNNDSTPDIILVWLTIRRPDNLITLQRLIFVTHPNVVVPSLIWTSDMCSIAKVEVFHAGASMYAETNNFMKNVSVALKQCCSNPLRNQSSAHRILGSQRMAMITESVITDYNFGIDAKTLFIVSTEIFLTLYYVYW